ncbi:hypothetical protein ACFQU7_31520 [Pseudoroseomonas wenyumeiae]
MAPQHRLAAQPVVRAADLHGETFIALSRGRPAGAGGCRPAGQRARPIETVECRLAAGAVAMAAAGVGPSRMPFQSRCSCTRGSCCGGSSRPSPSTID